MNYKAVAENSTVCGRCKQPARRDFPRTHMRVSTFPGKSTDQWEDFEDWDMVSLRQRVELVCEFDALADSVVAEAVYLAKNFEIQEETIYVPQKQKVLVSA
jgi:hypothetical protein